MEADHIRNKEHYTDNGEWMTFSRLILVDSAENVSIRGRGIIDGSGATLRAQGKPANLIRIRNSRNVSIEGVLLRDPAAWNTHIHYSDGVTIRDVKLINDATVPNTDGFDPDASANVMIDHCFAYCSDDNVAIKTTNNLGLNKDLRNIVVRGLRLPDAQVVAQGGHRNQGRAHVRHSLRGQRRRRVRPRAGALLQRRGAVREHHLLKQPHRTQLSRQPAPPDPLQNLGNATAKGRSATS